MTELVCNLDPSKLFSPEDKIVVSEVALILD